MLINHSKSILPLQLDVTLKKTNKQTKGYLTLSGLLIDPLANQRQRQIRCPAHKRRPTDLRQCLSIQKREDGKENK